MLRAETLKLRNNIEAGYSDWHWVDETNRYNVIRAGGIPENYFNLMSEYGDTLSIALTETSILVNCYTLMDAQERQIYGKVLVTYTDPSLDENVTFTATADGVDDTAYNTYPIQTSDGVYATKYKWFGIAHGENLLDGTYHPMPSPATGSVGWWSKSESSANASIAEYPVHTVTITHAATSTGDLYINWGATAYYTHVSITSGDTIEQIVEKIVAFGPVTVPGIGTWTIVKSGTTKVVGTFGAPMLCSMTEMQPDCGITATIERTVLGDAGNGGYAFTYPLVLQVTFDVPRPMYQMKVVGDNIRNEYPPAFEITCESYDYGGYTGWHTELDIIEEANTWTYWTKTVGSDPVEGVFAFPVGNLALTDVKRLTLTVYKWSHPETQAKIAEFFSAYFEEYYGDDLISIKVLEETEPDAATIPMGNISSNEITVRFNNIDRKFDPGNEESVLYGKLTRNRRIQAWLGVQPSPDYPIEYAQLGEFWSQDWSAPEGEAWAETTGWDRLEFLRTTNYSTSAVYENLSLGEMAEKIFESAGVTIDQYVIHEDFYSIIIPYAWSDNISHREALKRIAESSMGRVYCDRVGRIILEPYTPPTVSEYSFTRDNYFTKDHPLKWTEICNYVEVHATPLIPDIEQEIYQDTTPTSLPGNGATTTMFYIFNATPAIDIVTPITFEIEGGNLLSGVQVRAISIYSWAASVSYKNYSADPKTLISVSILGKPMISGGTISVTASDSESIRANGKQVSPIIENDLIQTPAQARIIAETMLASYKDPRRDLTLNARGNIWLHLGDRVTAPDYLDATLTDYTIGRQEITWDGGLRVDVTARRVV
jgi:hypothetical protein